MLGAFRSDSPNAWGIWSTAAHGPPHAGEQFLGTEGFRDVVVRAEFKKENLILHLCICAQYYNRHARRLSLKGAAEFFARKAREFQIEHDHAGGGFAKRFQAGDAV